MNQYIVTVTVPIYYTVKVQASSPELAQIEAIPRFHDFQREPLDYGYPKALRARLSRTEIRRASPTHSHKLHGRWHR